jgi:3-methyladenine DNA glycosylase AlkD
MKTDFNYFEQLHQALLAAGNPNSVEAMSAYMRHQFEFYGLKNPERKKLLRNFILENGSVPPISEETIKFYWGEPYREMHYILMEHLEKQKTHSKKESINLIEWLITHQSWWVSVDFVASHLLGKYVLNFGDEAKQTLENWNNSENIWLVRSTLIFQLSYKEKTDFELIKQFISKHLHSNEFFIQKAIGWALRQYARTDSEAVFDFVNRNELKPLSKREALKHFKP